MSVVARFEGLIEASTFVSSLTRIMNDNETALEVARADRRERAISQHLREEQVYCGIELITLAEEGTKAIWDKTRSF